MPAPPLKRGFWIVALAAFLVAAGVFLYFMNMVLLEDRRGPIVPSSIEGEGPRQNHLNLTEVPLLWTTASQGIGSAGVSPALLSEHPEVHFQWSVGNTGVAHVTLPDPPGQTRLPALVAEGGTAYEWTGVLPSSASFECRIGILSREAGFHLTVDLVDPSGHSQQLFSETKVSPPPVPAHRWGALLPMEVQSLVTERANTNERWHPLRVDLSAWSGRSVHLFLRVEACGDPLSHRPGLVFWGAPRIWFPVVPKPLVKRSGPRVASGTSVVLAVVETTPAEVALEGSSEGVPSQLGDFLRESVSFSRFYTSDIRSGKALNALLFSQPLLLSTTTMPSLSSPWPRVLDEKGYCSLAVGAFSDEMMTTLTEAGFDEIHQLPHDGYDSLLAAGRAAQWARDRGRGPVLVLLFFRDLPPFRWPPARFWAYSLRRFPWSPLRWVLWRRATAATYIDGSMGRVMDSLNEGAGAPLVGAVSLRGEVVDPSPVRWPVTGRRGKIFLEERGLGLREGEIKILFALRQGDRWTPALCRSPGQIPDVGPTLLKALDLPVPPGSGRAWDVGAAARTEESNGGWVVRSPWAKALIVDGRYKYIRHGPPGTHLEGAWGLSSSTVWTDFPVEEIFDIWDDPGELKNLTRSRRHLLARVREVLGETDPDPVDVRLGFLNPSGARVDGRVTCSAGAIAEVGGTVPVVRGGSYEFSFSTTSAFGTVTFQTWPPDSSYSMHLLVEGHPLSSGQFQVSRWGLPLFESTRNEWHDKTEFGWMDGWSPPTPSTAPVASLGRVPAGPLP